MLLYDFLIMMKVLKRVFVVYCVFVMSSYTLKAQDVIVSVEGDTIIGRIIKQEGNVIFYRATSASSDSTLPLSEVKYFNANYYSITSDIPKDIVHEFRLDVSGGLSILLWKVPSGFPYWKEKYIKGIRSGNHIACNMDFLLRENTGIGIKYCLMRTIYGINDAPILMSNGQTAPGIIKDDITIQYMGISFSIILKMGSKKLFTLNSRFSGGYLDYRNNRIFIEQLYISSKTFAGSADLGIEYFLTRHFVVGITTSIMVGVLSDHIFGGAYIPHIPFNFPSRSNISRVDIGLALKAYL